MTTTSLAEQIDAFSAEMAQNAPKEALEAIGAGIEVLAKSGQAEKALKKGDRAASFELSSSAGEKVSLESLLGKGPVVVSFNRGNWCPFGNLELEALNEAMDQIEPKASLVVVTPQLPAKSEASRAANGYRFQVLHDEDNRVAREYGLVFSMPEALRPIHEAFQMNVPEWNGNDSWELPFPATYVIGTDGKIAYSFVDANWMKRSEPADVVAAVDALTT